MEGIIDVMDDLFRDQEGIAKIAHAKNLLDDRTS